MTLDPVRFSVIVPAYNEAEILPSTLASLYDAIHNAPWKGELIVVDNNSTDATADVARTAGAKVVFEAYNQISRARNAGAAVAQGDWLVFVDADTRIDPGLLFDALSHLESGKVAGGGSEVNFPGSAPWSARALNKFWNYVSRTMKLAAGCFIFCRKDAFDAVGGFSERVYASEEVWLSRALARWGKARGMTMCILRKGGLETSDRKLKWHGQLRVLAFVALMGLFPIAVRWRGLCSFWYQRPDRN